MLERLLERQKANALSTPCEGEKKGLGRIFKRGSTFCIAYYVRGKERWEDSHWQSEAPARKLLKKRLGELDARGFINPEEERLYELEKVKRLAKEKDYSKRIWIEPTEEMLSVSDTIELIDRGVQASITYLLLSLIPEVQAKETEFVCEWLKEVGKETFAERGVALWRRDFTAFTSKAGISCRLSFDRLAIQGEGSKVNTSLMPSLTFYRVAPPRYGISIMVCFGGDQLRAGRRLANYPSHHLKKRLYFPTDRVKAQGLQLWKEDAEALVCLYLIQARVINLDDDEKAKTFICSYLGSFKGAKEVNILSVLGKLLENYRFPEDYRAFRKYVAKTIHWMASQEKAKRSVVDPALLGRWDKENFGDEQDEKDTVGDSTVVGNIENANRRQWEEGFDPTERDDLMIPDAAERLGISSWLLYDLIKKGKALSKKVSLGNRSFLTIPRSEIDRLEPWLKEKKIRKGLIRKLAAKTGIANASARRWVERCERQGSSLPKILQRVKERQ